MQENFRFSNRTFNTNIRMNPVCDAQKKVNRIAKGALL